MVVDANSGFGVEHLDVQHSQDRAGILEGARRTAIKRVMLSYIPGSSFHKVKTVARQRRLVTQRCSFLACLMAHRYKAELYRLVISG